MFGLNPLGIYKFVFPKTFVENKYKSMFQISFLGIDKNVVYLDPNAKQPIAIFHSTNCTQNIKIIKQYEEIFQGTVYVLPDQDSPQTFNQLKNLFLNPLGKTDLRFHPLVKYLKKNCTNIYNQLHFGAEKLPKNGAFVQTQNQVFVHYSLKDIQKYISQKRK